MISGSTDARQACQSWRCRRRDPERSLYRRHNGLKCLRQAATTSSAFSNATRLNFMLLATKIVGDVQLGCGSAVGANICPIQLGCHSLHQVRLAPSYPDRHNSSHQQSLSAKLGIACHRPGCTETRCSFLPELSAVNRCFADNGLNFTLLPSPKIAAAQRRKDQHRYLSSYLWSSKHLAKLGRPAKPHIGQSLCFDRRRCLVVAAPTTFSTSTTPLFHLANDETQRRLATSAIAPKNFWHPLCRTSVCVFDHAYANLANIPNGS